MGKGHPAMAKHGRAPGQNASGDAASAGAVCSGRKDVGIGVEWICIRRRIADIETWVNVPTSSYRGITLRSVASGDLYEVVLLHMDPSLEVILLRTKDDTDIIALWRGYGRMLRLPLLAEDQSGRLQPIADGDNGPFPRRLGSPLKSRRPRFLACRRPGSLAEGPVHRGEAAISCGA